MPACCRRRARFCSIFSWSRTATNFCIDVAKDKADELVKRLNFYRLRAQVDIAEEPCARRGGGVGHDSPHRPKAPSSMPIRRLAALGVRMLLPTSADLAMLGCDPTAEAEYHAFRISQGVPEGGRDYAFGETFPHEALFDQLNGVDFAKGCYVGQEVVSRMEHRGTARKRIVPRRGGSAAACVRHRHRG